MRITNLLSTYAEIHINYLNAASRHVLIGHSDDVASGLQFSCKMAQTLSSLSFMALIGAD